METAKTYSIYKKLVLQDERSKKLDFNVDGREHYVYRITDYTRTEEEHYYGSHTPEFGKEYNSLEEEFWTYRTSSKRNILNENRKEDYKVKILKVFDNPADKMIYEAYLHQYFDVTNNKHFWNGSNQTPFGWNNTNMVVTSERKWVTKEEFNEKNLTGLMKNHKHSIKYNKNYVVTKSLTRISQEEFNNSSEVGVMKNVFCGFDKDGNKVVLEKDENFDINEYTGYHKNKVVARDKDGNKFHVDKRDPRYLSGELVGHTKGKVVAKDKDGNKFNISVDDPRYLSGELVNINKGSMPKPYNIKNIEIFDNNGNLIYSINEGFQNFCRKNNLPYNAFRQSYLGCTKLGERNRETTSLINKGFKEYLGWYARIK